MSTPSRRTRASHGRRALRDRQAEQLPASRNSARRCRLAGVGSSMMLKLRGRGSNFAHPTGTRCLVYPLGKPEAGSRRGRRPRSSRGSATAKPLANRSFLHEPLRGDQLLVEAEFGQSLVGGHKESSCYVRRPGPIPRARFVRSAGPASRILFAWAPTSRALEARREIAGFRPGFWPQGQLSHPSSSGARVRLRLLPDPQPLADLCDEAAHRVSLGRFRPTPQRRKARRRPPGA